MIVITTPTGQIGHEVIRQLLAAGEPLRVIVRDPARLPEDIRSRVDVVQGSHSDPAVLEPALAGADSIFWLIPPDMSVEDVAGYYVQFTLPLTDAIKSGSVSHVVAVSTLGHGEASSAGHLSAALAMDELIRATSVSYRALANPFFLENILGQLPRLTGEGVLALANSADRPLPLVATRDIASAAATLLRDRSWHGQQRVPVISPDRLTPAQMTRTLGETLGREIRFEQLSLASYKQMLTGFGVSDGCAQALTDMVAAQNDGFYDAEWNAARSWAPTSLKAWCEEVLKPAALV